MLSLVISGALVNHKVGSYAQLVEETVTVCIGAGEERLAFLHCGPLFIQERPARVPRYICACGEKGHPGYVGGTSARALLSKAEHH